MTYTLVFLIIIPMILLGFIWCRWYGWKRGVLATFCRMGWLSIILCSLFPQILTIEVPQTLAKETIHVYVDDSQSMNSGKKGSEKSAQTEKYLSEMNEYCRSSNCIVKQSHLSELNSQVKDGFSPIQATLSPWLHTINHERWVVLSDGGDQYPSKPWDESLKDLGAINNKKLGFVLDYSDPDDDNIWIQGVDLPSFSFETKPINSFVTIERKGNELAEKKIQVQVSLNGKVLKSISGLFRKGKRKTLLDMTLPGLQRGRYLVKLIVLPDHREKVVWDNEKTANIEVLPDTVGVLHLLGAPSWDGRFLRRHLKAEPKYDLVSFFILRDPEDYTPVSDRELSLIPFPVKRLFNEELPKFKLIVLQNFNLLQFLMPEYQRNLVNYVKNGGGLLFIGGPRALTRSDLRDSPLSEILPFKMGKEIQHTRLPISFSHSAYANMIDDSARNPWYQPNQKFKVRLARPNAQQRQLATIFDDWSRLYDVFENWDDGEGLHEIAGMKFDEENSTVLLEADIGQGKNVKKVPLSVASYPGVGRAIWLFSDSFWKLAFSESNVIAREYYDRFMGSAINWLLRDEYRKSLIVKSVFLEKQSEQEIGWQATLQGPATQYFAQGKKWSVSVCNQAFDMGQIVKQRMGNQLLSISGQFKGFVRDGSRCEIKIYGEHRAFGKISAYGVSELPASLNDQQIYDSTIKLEHLARLTGAMIENVFVDKTFRKFKTWLESGENWSDLLVKQKYEKKFDYYWFIKSFWIYLVFLLIPLEVLIRRWDKIF